MDQEMKTCIRLLKQLNNESKILEGLQILENATDLNNMISQSGALTPLVQLLRKESGNQVIELASKILSQYISNDVLRVIQEYREAGQKKFSPCNGLQLFIDCLLREDSPHIGYILDCIIGLSPLFFDNDSTEFENFVSIAVGKVEARQYCSENSARVVDAILKIANKTVNSTALERLLTLRLENDLLYISWIISCAPSAVENSPELLEALLRSLLVLYNESSVCNIVVENMFVVENLLEVCSKPLLSNTTEDETITEPLSLAFVMMLWHLCDGQTSQKPEDHTSEDIISAFGRQAHTPIAQLVALWIIASWSGPTLQRYAAKGGLMDLLKIMRHPLKASSLHLAECILHRVLVSHHTSGFNPWDQADADANLIHQAMESYPIEGTRCLARALKFDLLNNVSTLPVVEILNSFVSQLNSETVSIEYIYHVVNSVIMLLERKMITIADWDQWKTFLNLVKTRTGVNPSCQVKISWPDSQPVDHIQMENMDGLLECLLNSTKESERLESLEGDITEQIFALALRIIELDLEDGSVQSMLFDDDLCMSSLILVVLDAMGSASSVGCALKLFMYGVSEPNRRMRLINGTESFIDEDPSQQFEILDALESKIQIRGYSVSRKATLRWISLLIEILRRPDYPETTVLAVLNILQCLTHVDSEEFSDQEKITSHYFAANVLCLGAVTVLLWIAGAPRSMVQDDHTRSIAGSLASDLILRGNELDLCFSANNTEPGETESAETDGTMEPQKAFANQWCKLLTQPGRSIPRLGVDTQNTCLFVSCTIPNVTFLQQLTTIADINPTFAAEGDVTSVHVAVMFGNAEAVEYLLSHCDVDIDAVDELGFSPLLRALARPVERSVEALFGEEWEARVQSWHKVAQVLLAHDVDLHISNPNDGTFPVHWCMDPKPVELTWYGHLITFQKHYHDFDMLKTILDAGGNINACDRHGATALHHTVKVNEIQASMTLLDLDADPNITDKDGLLPFHYACQNKSELLFALLEKGSERAIHHGKYVDIGVGLPKATRLETQIDILLAECLFDIKHPKEICESDYSKKDLVLLQNSEGLDAIDFLLSEGAMSKHSNQQATSVLEQYIESSSGTPRVELLYAMIDYSSISKDLSCRKVK